MTTQQVVKVGLRQAADGALGRTHQRRTKLARHTASTIAAERDDATILTLAYLLQFHCKQRPGLVQRCCGSDHREVIVSEMVNPVAVDRPRSIDDLTDGHGVDE